MCGGAAPRLSLSHCQGQSEVVFYYVSVLQDALSEVIKKYPPLKLRVFVADITALLR